MMALNNLDQLFLLEFLIDHVAIYLSKFDLNDDVLLESGPIVVKFQFLNYPVIDVCEEDFTANTKSLADEKRTYFKSGRSCMFSLNSSMEVNNPKLNLKLSVVKRTCQTKVCLAAKEQPVDRLIGNTSIDLTDMFKELFEKSKEDSSEKLSRTKTAAHKLINGYKEVGKIVFLIRLSSFGYMIMTGFKPSKEDRKNFKVKHISEKIEKKTSPSVTEKSSPVETKLRKEKEVKRKKIHRSITTRSDENHLRKSVETDRVVGSHRSEPFCRDDSLKSAAIPLDYCGVPKVTCCRCICTCRRNQVSTEKAQYSCRCQQTGEKIGQYNNFQGSLSPVQYQEPYQYQSQSFNSPYPQTPGSTQTQTNQNKLNDMDLDPGAVGIRGNQMVFKMPDKNTAELQPMEGKFAASVYYKVNEQNEETARNIVKVIPEKSPYVQEQLPNDKQDVFLLKIGKKRLSVGKKPKLELELKTPKMKEEKPETGSQFTQYLESDIPKPPKPTKAQKSKSKTGTADSKKKKK